MSLRGVGIELHEVAFLDDAGRNLETAREPGITTVKTDAPEPVLRKRESAVDFPLL